VFVKNRLADFCKQVFFSTNADKHLLFLMDNSLRFKLNH